MTKYTGGRRLFSCLFQFFSVFLAAVFLFHGTAQANSRYAAIVVDAHTGKVLYASHADAPRYPASLTKVMTLYILFEYLTANRLTYDTRFYVTPTAAAKAPSKLGLKAGTYVRVIDLIRGLVTKSANDAAAVIAENLAGTEANFARVMTRRARALGMRATTFRNASGLPDPRQKTTARDMAILARRILQDFPKLSRFFRTRYFSFHGRRYRNHNRLLFTYRGTEGIKTGYTKASGFHLMTSVRRNNKHLIAVVMGGKTAKRRDRHMRALLDRYFPRAVARKAGWRRVARRAAPPKRQSPKIQVADARGSMPKTGGRVVEQGSRDGSRMASPSSRKLDPSRGFAIQVGAFTSHEIAQFRLANLRQAMGRLLAAHPPYVMRFEKDGKTFYRARFLHFASRDQASSVCRAMKRRKMGCYVVAPTS